MREERNSLPSKKPPELEDLENGHLSILKKERERDKEGGREGGRKREREREYKQTLTLNQRGETRHLEPVRDSGSLTLQAAFTPRSTKDPGMHPTDPPALPPNLSHTSPGCLGWGGASNAYFFSICLTQETSKGEGCKDPPPKLISVSELRRGSFSLGPYTSQTFPRVPSNCCLERLSPNLYWLGEGGAR